jgi:hypothetical protein
MTVSKDYNKHVYEGNGLTTDWPYDFDLPITAAGAPDTSLIHVFRTNLRGEVTEVTAFSVDAETGTLTYPTSGSPLETGEKLTILRLLDVRQQFFDPSNQANLYPETLEDNTDRLVMMIQQIDESVSRAVKMGEGYEGEEVTAEGLLEARDIAISAAETAEGYANMLPAIADELDVNIVLDEADLRAKLAAIGASNASLVIATTIPIAADLAIPSNVALSFKRAGQLQPAVGTTLTINGAIDAGLWQIFGGEGTVAIGYRLLVNARWFGATGDGVTDDTAALQRAVDAGDVFIPNGDYLVSDTLLYGTDDQDIYLSVAEYGMWVKNGRRITGESKNNTIIRQAALFPSGKPIISFDGNVNNRTDYYDLHPVAQFNNSLSNICIKGRWKNEEDTTPVIGLYLRAIWNSSFKDILIENIYGDGLVIGGQTTGGRDDIDTTAACTFENIYMNMISGDGIKAIKSRPGSLTFTDCSLRRCHSNGYVGGGASVRFRGCTISLCCGYGIKIQKTETEALPRGIEIANSMLEGNFKGDIFIHYSDSFDIHNCCIHPYLDSINTPPIWNEGGIIVKECLSGNISNNLIQPYTSNPGVQEFIYGIVVHSTTKAQNLNIVGNYIKTADYKYSISQNPVTQPDKTGATKTNELFNTFTMFEKGTFTLTGITGTYTARYERLGNMVSYVVELPVNTVLTAAILTGLPYASQIAQKVNVYLGGGLTYADNEELMIMISGTSIYLRKYDATTGAYSVMSTPWTISEGTVTFSGTYMTADNF